MAFIASFTVLLIIVIHDQPAIRPNPDDRISKTLLSNGNFYLFFRSVGFLFIRSSGFGLLDQLDHLSLKYPFLVFLCMTPESLSVLQ